MAHAAPEVPYTDLATSEVPELTEEQKHDLQVRMKEIDMVFAREGKAKYKLELFLGKERSRMGTTAGVLQFFESGKQFHGGGDSKVYVCPGLHRKVNNCSRPIPSEFNIMGFQTCPSCKTTWKGTETIGEIHGRHTMQQWAQLLYLYYTRLDHNADIVIKHSTDDLRSAAAAEQVREHRGDKLGKARVRAMWVYPLANMIKDASCGRDLQRQFYLLLTELPMSEEYKKLAYKKGIVEWEITQIELHLLEEGKPPEHVIENEHVLFVDRETPQSAIRDRLYELRVLSEKLEEELNKYTWTRQPPPTESPTNE